MATRSVEGEIVPKLDFREIITLNVRLLQACGYIIPDAKSTIQIIGYYFLRAGAILVISSLITSEVVNMIMVMGDVEKWAEGSFVTITLLGYTLKMYAMFKNKNKVNCLIHSCNRTEFQPKSTSQYRSLKSYIYQSKMISKVFLSAAVGTCVFLVGYPLFEGGEIVLPLAGWYPFDITNFPAFAIAYIFQAFAATFAGLNIVIVDTFISGSIMTICAQLHILNDSLTNIRKYAEVELEDKKARVRQGISPELQKKMDEKLVQCIVHHRCILEFADNVTFVFSNSIFGQFIASILIICAALFQIMLLPWTSTQFFFVVMYEFCLLSENFLLCYYGNEVIRESMELVTSAYFSDWIDCSTKYKRNLLFFMTRSQRKLQLYAGEFFVLSLETFVKIVKSAWSFCAYLNTVYSEES